MTPPWRSGNSVQLLEDGDAFFPRVFEQIRNAKSEIILETFIINEDKVGWTLHAELIAAAQRGVAVIVTADGFGSGTLSPAFIEDLARAGVQFHLFNPGYTLFGIRTNLLRRMHRKIVVIDAQIAYVGGINFIADQLSDFGKMAKRDYAVEITGPVVADIHNFVVQPGLRRRHLFRRRHKTPTTAATGFARVRFVTRDNFSSRTAIEAQYRLAIAKARDEITIANAYFLPGYRLLWRLGQAARRGVNVNLILQGHPDIAVVRWASRLLYEYLLSRGVNIYEYVERPLHGKVALADGEWSTVGSSNLDPLSLSLNLEANVIIHDREFTAALRERLERLRIHQSHAVEPQAVQRGHWWQAIFSSLVFHVLRHYPRWATLLPTHRTTLKTATTDTHEAGDLPATTAPRKPANEIKNKSAFPLRARIDRD